jgi:hypothetical protein
MSSEESNTDVPIKIVSWDVGIKNLAYCVIEKKNNKFTIEKWGLINLSENNKLCQHVLSNGKTKGTLCGKTAQIEIKNKDNAPFLANSMECSFYACKAHAEKFSPEFDTSTKKDKKCIMGKCKCIATRNVKGSDAYCWCQEHYEKGKEKFLKRIAKKKISGTSCMKQSVDSTAYKLYTILDKIPELMQVEKVLIENQPSMKNPTMKTIASLLFGYFVMRGFVDKNITKSTVKELKFVSPSNKLKVNKTTTDNVLAKGKETDKVYKMTKKLGVKYCQSLITKKDLDFLTGYKKKDDLCDAFLQGFQYLFTPVPQEYVEKLETVGLETTEPKKIAKKVINKKKKENETSDDESEKVVESVPKKVSKKVTKKESS